MSATTRKPGDYPVPHLASFIETALSPNSKRVVMLRADVGFGKTHALLTLVSRLLKEEPTAKVLLLIPAAFRSQSVERLRDEGTPALLVDRYKFRELVDASPEREVWPQGLAVVLSDDFARKPDVMESLAGVQWDMVIADEAHRFTGARGELLSRVGATAKRVVLASATGTTLPEALLGEEATIVEWRSDQVVDHEGKRFRTAPPAVLHEVPFTLSQAERDLSETVHALGEVLAGGTVQSEFVAKILLRNLDSSPAALESVLRRVRNSLAHSREINVLPEEGDDNDVEDQARTPVVPATAGQALPVAAQALQELEAIETDSKVGAFSDLMVDLSAEKSPPGPRICVITDYLATLYYLAAEMEGQGLAYSLLNSRMTYEERLESLATFESTGGILLATTALIRGIDLPDVSDLVLYDLPGNDRTLYVLLARFRRTRRLHIHALVKPNGEDSAPSEPLRLLREMGSGQQGNEEEK